MENNEQNIQVKIVKVNKELPTPKYAHHGDAGMDIYAAENYMLQSGEFKLISAGIKLAIPYGYEVQVRPRSGLAAKHGISIVNTPGTIDCMYRGMVGVILINHGKNPFEVKRGERIAQLVFNKIAYASVEEVAELDETARGEGGFGSTGKH
ncbi:dUTP diphosphatase [Candidatus Woesearchaeota archaeon]|nr:dUTP diphosphatase [Candidatus Woesearchaeota archaeon]